MFHASVFTFTLLLCSCYAYYYYIDCNASERDPWLSPTADGVPGRYELNWCKSLKQIKTWHVEMTVNNKTRAECDTYKNQNQQKHSEVTFEILELKDYNCSTVCLSTKLDLMFRGCYNIYTFLTFKSSIRRESHYLVQYIDNQYDMQYFINNKYLLSSEEYDNVQPTRVVLKFFFGKIPVIDYDLELCSSEAPDNTNCSSIRDWCASPSPFSLRCAGAPRPGRYDAYFQHKTAWSNGDIFPFTTATLNFTTSGVPAAPAPVADGGAGVGLGVGVACGAVLLLVLATCGVVVLCRADCRHRDNLKALVQQVWRQRYAELHKCEDVGKEELEVDSILLLYARDCEPLMRAAAVLAELMRATVGCTVYDVHSAAVAAASARAPHAWVQRAVLSARTRLVLLETPAAAALYCGGGDLRTASPAVLGARARYRRAAPADSLLHYALRLLQDRAAAPLSYRKYYVGRLTSMPSDVLPTVVPFRRYLLPDHTSLLLRDLSNGTHAGHDAQGHDAQGHGAQGHDAQGHGAQGHDAQGHGAQGHGAQGHDARAAQLTATFADHLAQFTRHVAENPNYLAEHLVFL